MSMSANLHQPTKVEAHDLGLGADRGNLQLTSADGCVMNIFMPIAIAEAMEAAFNAHQPQPATDEAAE